MCIDDHLYKNILDFVREHGAYSADTFNMLKCRKSIDYTDLVDDDMLRRLLGFASYVVFDERAHNK